MNRKMTAKLAKSGWTEAVCAWFRINANSTLLIKMKSAPTT